MTRYSLALKDNNYIPIDWRNAYLWTKEKCESLENIIDFTTQFRDEMVFKDFLVFKKFISKEDYNKILCIISIDDNGKVKELPFGISYVASKEYFNPEFLYEKMRSMYGNLDYVQKCTSRYAYLEKELKKKYGFLDKEYLDYVFSYMVYPKCNEMGEPIINYEGLRELAMFSYKYEYMSNFKGNVDKVINEQHLKKEINESKKGFVPLEPEWEDDSFKELAVNFYALTPDNKYVEANDDEFENNHYHR